MALFLLHGLALFSCCQPSAGEHGTQPALGTRAPSAAKERSPNPEGMIWIPGGEFRMGSDEEDAWLGERPAHRVRVSEFWMDATEVTNAAFQAFVLATGYVTTAERPIEWESLRAELPEGTPKPADLDLSPGAIVFRVPASSERRAPEETWWTFVPGACWRHPEGPESDIEGKGAFPVVQVSWQDARAFAAWSGKRLPTEAEWEFAARGGQDGCRFVWGNDRYSEDLPQCNAWQGRFPWENAVADGFAGSAPVGSFAPNGYGLYDMAGNVWEWCEDAFLDDAYSRRSSSGETSKSIIEDPIVQPPKTSGSFARAMRGGSFLCHPSYCASYRPSARQGQMPDSASVHHGFRCVRDP